MIRLSITLALLLTLVAGGCRPRCDCWIGTWKLDLEKSKFTPGMAPHGVTLTYKAMPGGLQATLNGIDMNGAPFHISFSGKYDGTAEPATGSPAFDAVSVRRVDCRIIEITFTRGGNPATANRTVISKDCKEMTVTATGTGDQGSAVYVRQ
jgi:hypothetical protein